MSEAQWKVIDDLKIILKQDDKSVDAFIELIKKYSDDPESFFEKLLEETTDKESKLTNDVILALYRFSFSYLPLSKRKRLDELYNKLINAGFKNEEIDRLKQIISRFTINEFDSIINKINMINDATFVGLPIFVEMDINSDFRIVEFNNKKEVIPIIMLKLITSQDGEEKTNIIQLSSSSIKKMIENLSEFQRKYKDNLLFMKGKINHGQN